MTSTAHGAPRPLPPPLIVEVHVPPAPVWSESRDILLSSIQLLVLGCTKTFLECGIPAIHAVHGYPEPELTAEAGFSHHHPPKHSN